MDAIVYGVRKACLFRYREEREGGEREGGEKGRGGRIS